MEEELSLFTKNKVWNHEHTLKNQLVIGTKWVFKNKLNDKGEVVRNKIRLVSTGKD